LMLQFFGHNHNDIGLTSKLETNRYVFIRKIGREQEEI